MSLTSIEKCTKSKNDLRNAQKVETIFVKDRFLKFPRAILIIKAKGN